MPALVMGLDVGTGSAKCVVTSTDGGVYWSADSRYEYTRPQPGWAEQNPDDWWQASILAIRQILAEHPEVTDRLEAVGVCGQGASAVLLNKEFEPVRPAILWLDSRAAPQAKYLQDRFGPEIARVSGKSPASYNVEPKLLWVAEHEPEIWHKTATVMTTTAYVTHRLSGESVMNLSDGGVLLSYDLARKSWSDSLRQHMKLSPELYCGLSECDRVIGTVTKKASKETGLREGLPVIAGGEDTSAAALAAGVTCPELAILSLGTAGTIYVSSARPVTHPNLLTFPHVLSNLVLIGGSTVCGGSGLEWISKVLNVQSPSAFEGLMDETSRIPANAYRVIFLPYLSGELQPINDGCARGVFFGADFSTASVDVVAAVMQGTAFAFLHNLELIRQTAVSPTMLLATGKPARNKVFVQTISDVTGLPVCVMNDTGGAALGTAMLAAKAISPVNFSAGAMTGANRNYTVQPNWTKHQRLGELFVIYKELYQRLKDLFPHLQAKQTLLAKEEVV